ncbi:MAG: HAMP domain-containing histidine kinase [Alphaproteobacteria bacterium]|nr:HAMP domain-containing histidine kinase [Alphaproteobacteria bacterium]MCB9698021.1 HAMP domain-containing histidine kinase [Alphaproteobacteria bacterium]
MIGRRLYLQVYVGFVAVAVFGVVVAGIVGSWVWGDKTAVTDLVTGTAAVSELRADDPALEEHLAEVAEQVEMDITFYDRAGGVAGVVGEPIEQGEPGPFREHGRGGLRVMLADGRAFALAQRRSFRPRFFLTFGVLAGVLAVGCWPLARRITRRLEEVRDGVARWGDGDLSARVVVRGQDEVAAVARTFNEAADRVQRSFEAQRRVLASASHDLRSPLARLRMAIELLDDGTEERASLCEAAVRDVEELDLTVGDLLQVGRMQASDGPENAEPVDLVAILEEEAARVGAAVAGSALVVDGEPALLRRLARNLLENAARHGAPPIEVRTTATGFEVTDRGEGVPEELRERIFEPFFRPDGHAEGRDGSVGLGLHLCREIARYHRGDVRCLPREDGQGTRFVVDWSGALSPSGAASGPRAAPGARAAS